MGITPRHEDVSHPGTRTKVTTGVVVAVVLTLLATLVPMFTSPASAASVTPTFVDGNAKCGSLGFEHEVTINGVPGNQTYNITVDGVPGTFTVSNSTGTSFDWVSSIGVAAIFVKAGSGGFLYTYDPPAPSFGDTNLISPSNNNVPGQPQATISHLSICFDEPTTPEVDDLTIQKLADTSYVRDFDWTVDKVATPPIITTDQNTATFSYSVTATKGDAQDSGHEVNGTITIGNTNDFSVTLTNISDSNPACTLDFNGADPGLGTEPTSIGADSEIVVIYECVFADAATALATTTNTARVDWTDPIDQSAKFAEALAIYSWGAPDSVTDDCVDVTDTFNAGTPELLGNVCTNTTFPPYTRTVAVPTSGCTTYPNIATVHDTDNPFSDDETVTACRKTNDGFTRGFWTNKNGGKWITDHQAQVQGMLATYSNVLNGVGSTAAAIKAAIEGSNSSGDAFTQFRAQFLATALSVLKSPGGALGNQYVSGPGGACKTITEWLVYGNTNYGGALLDTKAELIELKDLYDAVNNNVAPLCTP